MHGTLLSKRCYPDVLNRGFLIFAFDMDWVHAVGGAVLLSLSVFSFKGFSRYSSLKHFRF